MDESYLEAAVLDARGIPSRECPNCGSDILIIKACFDEGYDICGYLLDAECFECHCLITAPTPLDLPDYV
jgi:hypothetical protein